MQNYGITFEYTYVYVHNLNSISVPIALRLICGIHWNLHKNSWIHFHSIFDKTIKSQFHFIPHLRLLRFWRVWVSEQLIREISVILKVK